MMHVKRYLAALVILIVTVVLAVGCATSGAAESGSSPTTEAVLSSLEREGVTLFPRGTSTQPFLSQAGEEYSTTRGGVLQIYEYASNAAADRDVEQINHFYLDRASAPHVFHKGRIIAILFGNDVTTEFAIADVLGPQMSR